MQALPDDVVWRSIDQLPSLIGYWDASLRNVFANRVYTDYFGLEPDAIRGMYLEDVLGAAMFALDLPYVTGALEGRSQLFDRTLIDARGTTRHTRATFVPDIVAGAVVGFTVLVVDVSARVEAERERDRAVDLFRVAMENAPIGNAMLTTDGRWLVTNRALCEITGYTSEELREMTFRDITHPDDLAAGDAALQALLDGAAERIASDKRYIRKDGSVVWVQRDVTLVRDPDHGDVVVAQIQDISERRSAQEALARQVVTDDLTGSGNRRRLMNELSGRGRDNVGLLYLDIDDFKSINDTHGHEVGDEILRGVARRLVDHTRDADVVCRIGGDEFVVLVRDARSVCSLRHCANRIADHVRGWYDVGGVGVDVSISVGTSWGRARGQLLIDADHAMYRDKRGRGSALHRARASGSSVRSRA
ncbi:GGDEF domain-containing protein [Rhodococcoides corynebacterioides]|uniref:GGDEF domain-containing protein n=1 Tax=Rhodococcoides corynebacterioides TaxID=53972 RepID=UPI00082C719C|nr:GGDEF domain-containing protein [Rhodococcus corynebacterioides]